MPVEHSELSSIAALLDQLARRIGAMGEAAQREKQDGVAAELFAIERSLTGANRRIGRLITPRR